MAQAARNPRLKSGGTYLSLREFSGLMNVSLAGLRRLLRKAPPSMVRRTGRRTLVNHRRFMQWLQLANPRRRR